MGSFLVCSALGCAAMLMLGIERFIIATRRDKAGHEMDDGRTPPRG